MENLHFQTVRWWLIIENVKQSKWILFLLENNYPLIGIICGWTNSCISSYVSSIPFLFTVFNQTPTNTKKTVPYSSAVGFLPILVLVIPTTIRQKSGVSFLQCHQLCSRVFFLWGTFHMAFPLAKLLKVIVFQPSFCRPTRWILAHKLSCTHFGWGFFEKK